MALRPRLLLRNRVSGQEQVMQLAHQRARGGCAGIDAVIPRAELEDIALRDKRLACFGRQGLGGR